MHQWEQSKCGSHTSPLWACEWHDQCYQEVFWWPVLFCREMLGWPRQISTWNRPQQPQVLFGSSQHPLQGTGESESHKEQKMRHTVNTQLHNSLTRWPGSRTDCFQGNHKHTGIWSWYNTSHYPYLPIDACGYHASAFLPTTSKSKAPDTSEVKHSVPQSTIESNPKIMGSNS
jgi:hypothetical protein